jgi:hypothetical protein
MTVESESPSARLSASTAQASSAPRHEPLLISPVSERTPAFFLQGGAMKNDANAYALARSEDPQWTSGTGFPDDH